MSWRTGAAMFREMWPTMQKHLAGDDEEWRVEFLAAVLKVFLECDMCPSDVRHIHPEIDRGARDRGSAALNKGAKRGQKRRFRIPSAGQKRPGTDPEKVENTGLVL